MTSDATRAASRDTARRTIATITAFVRVETASNMHYRLNLFIWMLTWALQVIVALAVWQAVAESRGGDAVGGFTSATFAGYYLVFLLVRLVTTSWTSWLMIGDAEKGDLSPHVVRPMSPLVVYWARTSGARIIQIAMGIPLAFGCWIAFDAHVNGSATAIAIALALLAPCMYIAFLIDMLLIGMPGFWMTKISGLMGIVGLTTALLSGLIAPIQLLPGWLETIALALPFYWTAGYPAELIVGTASIDSLPRAALVIGAWMIALSIVLRRIWPIALRRYEAVSG